MNMWFFYALIGALITGIGQAFVKKGQISLTPLLDNFLATIIVIFFLAPALYLFGVVDVNAWKDVWIYALVAATMYASFYYVINLGSVSLMVGLINSFPIITIILAILFLGELPSPMQWVGIVTVILGILLISRETADEKKTKSKLWILGGLLGAVAIGVAEFVTKLATNSIDGFTFTFFVYLMYAPPLLILFFLDKKGRKFKKLKHKSGLIYTLIGISFIELGLVAIALAYQFGAASLASPVIATHVLLTALLARIILKEKLNNYQKIGILLDLIGISIIGIWA